MHFRFRCQKMNGLVEPNIKFKKCKSEKSKNFISGRWRVHPKSFGWTTPCALHSYPSLHYIWVAPHCHHDAHYLSLLGRCSTNQKVLSVLVNATSSVAHIVSSEYKNLFYILSKDSFAHHITYVISPNCGTKSASWLFDLTTLYCHNLIQDFLDIWSFWKPCHVSGNLKHAFIFVKV